MLGVVGRKWILHECCVSLMYFYIPDSVGGTLRGWHKPDLKCHLLVSGQQRSVYVGAPFDLYRLLRTAIL